MPTVEKQALPVIIDEKGEPIAVIIFSPSRERLIYMLHKADEEEIISLLSPLSSSRAQAGEISKI
jgi:hypothetical protein